MPQFIPKCTPKTQDDFLRGYLACIEWLLPEKRFDAAALPHPAYRARRFSRGTLRAAREACRDFVAANRDDLKWYCDLSGRDMESAGHDFYLSRCGHGAGFFDRGTHPLFQRLQAAARIYRAVDFCVDRHGTIDQE